jgi:small-conductance mechanosensitive channel
MSRFFQIVSSPFRRDGTWSRAIIFLLFIAVVAAGYLGYLKGVITFLSSPDLTFKFQDVEITAYGIIKVVVFVALFLMLSATLMRALERQLTRVHGFDSSNRELVVKALQILTAFIAFIVALDILRIDLTAFAVLGGAVGIGIGFGLQKIASNFISGIILLMEKSIRLGDVIELPDGTWGTVRKIGGRYTLVESFDSKELMVPNEDFITSRVTNWTFSNTRARVTVQVGVAYGTDLDVAKQCITDAACQHPRCSLYPEPVVFLREFGDSSINFLLYFWIDDVRSGRYLAHSEVMFSIWRRFKEKGIEIPFPQRDIHIRSGLPKALSETTDEKS